MLKRILLVAFMIGLLASCKSSDSTTTKAAQPRYHKGYYKKHTHFKHYRVGRVHIKLFEKQGTKTVKKN